MPNPLPTVRSNLGRHILLATCRSCNHAATLDLAALMSAGQADTALLHLPLRCAQCEKRGHHITVSGLPFHPG